MFEFKVLFLINLLIIFIVCECKQYRNYTLYRGVPVTDTHLNFFQNLPNYYEVSIVSLLISKNLCQISFICISRGVYSLAVHHIPSYKVKPLPIRTLAHVVNYGMAWHLPAIREETRAPSVGTFTGLMMIMMLFLPFCVHFS